LVARQSNPSNLRSGDQGDFCSCPAQAKSSEDLSQPTAGLVTHAFHCWLRGKCKEEHCGPGWPGHEVRPSLKNNQQKMGWKYGTNGTAPA
jgi:hypothetical protein